MATLDLSNARQLVAMTDPNVVAFGIAGIAIADAWSYGALTGARTSIGIEPGDCDAGNPDIGITHPSPPHAHA
jgi:hypothetical protein